ncbi:MAG: DUF4412 domain-containing protein [Gemmatimonadota bacterium]
MQWKHIALVAGTVALTTIARPGVALAQFEGAQTFKVYGDDGKAHDMNTLWKGNKMRMDMPGGADGYVILDGDEGAVKTVMVSQKMAMIMKGQDIQEQMKAKAAERPEAPKGTFDIRKIGTATVAGVTCDVYAMKGSAEGRTFEAEMCMAKDAGFRAAGPMAGMMHGPRGGMGGMGGMGGGVPGVPGVSREMMEAAKGLLEGGIVKMTEIKDGKRTTRLELVSIERKPLDASLFTIPEGFQVHDASQMMQQMMKRQRPNN